MTSSNPTSGSLRASPAQQQVYVLEDKLDAAESANHLLQCQVDLLTREVEKLQMKNQELKGKYRALEQDSSQSAPGPDHRLEELLEKATADKEATESQHESFRSQLSERIAEFRSIQIERLAELESLQSEGPVELWQYASHGRSDLTSPQSSIPGSLSAEIDEPLMDRSSKGLSSPVSLVRSQPKATASESTNTLPDHLMRSQRVFVSRKSPRHF